MLIVNFVKNIQLKKRGEEKLEQLINSINFMLHALNLMNPRTERYSKAREVLIALKLLLNGQKTNRFTNEDLKLTMDVLKEIRMMYAENEDEKLYYEMCTEYCKQMLR